MSISVSLQCVMCAAPFTAKSSYDPIRDFIPAEDARRAAVIRTSGIKPD
jgi:hypothetical protein